MTTRASFEPRVLVLGNNRGRWRAQDRQEEAAFTNGIEAWVFAMKGDYIWTGEVQERDIASYDIIIANMSETWNTNWLPKLTRLGETRLSSTRWVTLVEGSAGDWLKPTPSLRTVFDTADLVNCINEASLPFLRRLTTARVEYIGVPYPVDGVHQFAVPMEKRRKAAFICPYLLSRWNDYLVAKELGLEYYGYERRISRRLNTVLPTIRRHRSLRPEKYINRVKALYADSQLDIRVEVFLKGYFQANASAYLWLNLDDRYTWGRYVLDAAALGIPIITTRSTGHGELLFPMTTVDNEFDLDKAVELGRRLVKDEDFYREVAAYPAGRMEHLKPEAMNRKLLHLLGML